jgi:hypothetical protein
MLATRQPARHAIAMPSPVAVSGVGGVQVDLAGAASGQHRVAGSDGDDPAFLHVLYIYADAEAVDAGRSDQVDGKVLLQQHESPGPHGRWHRLHG